MLSLSTAYCALLLFVMQPVTAGTAPRTLSDEAWHADIEQMIAALKSNHPNLYRAADEEEFDGAARTLVSRLPGLTDKQIIIEMAKIVAMAHDGHTRLSLPRQHEELAFSFSHSSPKEPSFPSLAFSSLPFQLMMLEGHLFISRATEEYHHLVGAEVIAFENTPAEEAVKRLSAINYNDNFMTDMLLAGDRASLPEALEALDIISSADRVSLQVRPYGQATATQVTVSPLGEGKAQLYGPSLEMQPLRLRHTDTVQWAQPIASQKAHFIQLNQIAAGIPDSLLADFMREEVRKAEEAGAEKLIIDLRRNHGGAGGFARSVINAVAPSRFNEYGRLDVLIGRETFSAAEMLVNELEQYTDVLFFGEPTGANPDTYGDPKRIQLENSGLDLRVSRLHWSTWRAFETRTATAPHFPVAYTIDNYMNGRDPALDAALAYQAPAELSALVSDVFENDVEWRSWDGAQIIFSRYLTDPRIEMRNLPAMADELVGEGKARERENKLRAAMLLYISAQQLNEELLAAFQGWARTAMAIGETSEAESAVKAGLAHFPDDPELEELASRID